MYCSWFAVTMGIGITALILYDFPFTAKWLQVLGIIVWGITMVQFLVSNIFFALRFIIYPEQFMKMLRHPHQSMFLGCWPMGFATIINLTDSLFKQRAWKATYAMWWIDIAATLFSAWIVVFLIFSVHTRDSDTLNATILLPVVALVVAGSTGGLIAQSQPADLQESSAIVSLLLWANGELLGFSFIVIYLCRMIMNKLPPRLIAVSSFLPLGPLGQGAFGVQNISDVFCMFLTNKGVAAQTVNAVHYLGVITALVLTGYATFWFVMACSTCLFRRPNKFNMSFWALTFPIGTYVTAWYKLASELGLLAFKVLGAIFGCTVILTVLFCTIFTVKFAVFSDELFSQAADETSERRPSLSNNSKV